MYGLVNKAIQHLVIRDHGEGVWAKIRERAGVRDPEFVSLRSYPDEVTYGLVGAICAELGAPADRVLELFGEYWVGFAASQGYGPILDFFGRDLGTFLHSLDALHARLRTVFTHLLPPSLECEDIATGVVRLHYRSSRPGLTHFVVGLLHGIGKRFNQAVVVEIEARRSAGADHDTFIVRFDPSGGI